mmetsp:Transcript_76690/g.225126  ORF Transcript_76690/g.225126 Transcript_76690/m.225126 type:complete len:213 (-) Transcript_76690:455-1093(-)
MVWECFSRRLKSDISARYVSCRGMAPRVHRGRHTCKARRTARGSSLPVYHSRIHSLKSPPLLWTRLRLAASLLLPLGQFCSRRSGWELEILPWARQTFRFGRGLALTLHSASWCTSLFASCATMACSGKQRCHCRRRGLRKSSLTTPLTPSAARSRPRRDLKPCNCARRRRRSSRSKCASARSSLSISGTRRLSGGMLRRSLPCVQEWHSMR